jgi:hypothetical protein
MQKILLSTTAAIAIVAFSVPAFADTISFPLGGGISVVSVQTAPGSGNSAGAHSTNKGKGTAAANDQVKHGATGATAKVNNLSSTSAHGDAWSVALGGALGLGWGRVFDSGCADNTSAAIAAGLSGSASFSKGDANSAGTGTADASASASNTGTGGHSDASASGGGSSAAAAGSDGGYAANISGGISGAAGATY